MISDQPLLTLKVKVNENTAAVKIVCGHEQEIVKIANHPLFALVEKIVLEDSEENKKCLRLLTRGHIELPYRMSLQIIKRCKQNFKVDVKIDLHKFAISVIIPGDQKQVQKKNKTIYEILDNLDHHIVLKIFKNAYESLGSKIHSRVTRKLKNYIDCSQRKEEEKKSLLDVYNLYKQACQQENLIIKKQSQVPIIQSSSVQQNQSFQKSDHIKKQQNSRAEGQKNRNVKPNYKQEKWSKQKYVNNWSREKYRGRNSKSKETKIDDKIILGITGDTQAGWRQRMRPSRIPASRQPIVMEKQEKQVKQERKQVQKKQEEVKKVEEKKQKVEEKKQINNSGAASSPIQKIFTFPEDGNEFDFGSLSQFTICVNKSFWLKYKNSSLQILKDNVGYIRKTDIEPLGKTGFQAEGLTINLDGLSTLEDGGQKIGEPTTDMILGGPSQNFHIKSLSIYVPKSDQ